MCAIAWNSRDLRREVGFHRYHIERSNKAKESSMLEETKELMLSLKQRWHSPAGKAILEKVLSAIRLQQPWTSFLLTLSDVEDVLNRRDLQGAPLSGLELNNVNFRETTLDFVELRGASLEYADFRGAQLNHADLSGAKLCGANFEGCLMVRANLAGADLSNASLAGSALTGANLVRANFSQADLTNAVLFGAETEDAVFDGAILTNTRFGKFAS